MLSIPPAWKEVWISPSKRGHLQATGIDEQGRKQYIYHSEWTAERQLEKVQRMIAFGTLLPKIRRHMANDMRRKTPVKEKVVAVALKVMEETLIRVGNEQYLQKYKSYGLTTLKKKHVSVGADTVEFCFRGKKRVHQEIRLRDARLAAKLKEIEQLAGPFFFQYINESGERHRLHARDINGYLQRHAEMPLSAKDYRTWYAGVWTFRLLAKCPKYDDEKSCKSNVLRVLDAVSERLGNTRSVCKQYYVPDNLISAYEDGSLTSHLLNYQRCNRRQTTRQAEIWLLEFFKQHLIQKKQASSKLLPAKRAFQEI